MIAHRLKLEGFRNYRQLDVSFHPGVNVIVGDNAQGKTNLIEAIRYFSSCRSHRARTDRELIGFDHEAARMELFLESRNRDFKLEAQLRRGQRRSVWSNGVRLKSAGELSGILNTVLFCPEDLSLIKAGGAERRRFLDEAISQLRPRYAEAIAAYRRLQEQKTRVLKDYQDDPAMVSTLEIYSQQMCRLGAQIIHYRTYYLDKLNEFAPRIHRDFSGGREELGLSYQTVSTVTDPHLPLPQLYEALLEHMESHRRAEWESRSCLSGPHKDDIAVEINGVSARTFGSQGQTRTAALSLKLAEREIVRDDREEYPVLLLDDVLSELDPRRQEFVLNRIDRGQVFITCCEEEKQGSLRAGKVIRVENGRAI
ncbi:MAG: DNA replication/repair protein RecF [Oscillospiraceae bacterium]|nr:DNA replication/repair protein RecF [Oscillospiraceae bacterium]